MNSLVDSLKRFNRKERNLLVRAILAQESRPLELSEEFRMTVAHALQLPPIPSDAWWATDYHIAWLAGALAVYVEQAVAKGARPNRSASVNGLLKHLVEGNQEDCDLVIASGVDLIFIEAKGVSAWDVDQLNSKLTRLELLHCEYISSVTRAPSAVPRVNFHFLLMSPHQPDPHSRIMREVPWPDWIRVNGDIPWVQLAMPSDTLAVSRCNAQGAPAAQPDHWCIIRVPSTDSRRTEMLRE
jgi:hypothetical protein